MSLAPVRTGGVAAPSRRACPPCGLDNKLFLLAFGSIGIVFGDIGTSPLYALRECFHGQHALPPEPANILGVLSLVFWSMTVVVGIKYVTFILRADNRGEGGIFALLGLLSDSDKTLSPALRTALVSSGILGAGLLYGDGIITPAISVLSAVEGLKVATRAAAPYVMPLTCVILVFLFLLQHRGTHRIGRLFGPVMMIWFVSIAAFGLIRIAAEPRVLLAVNPLHAVDFFMRNGASGIVVLGSVVLCVTGCEALYADLGHFGKGAIRLSWLGFVGPALLCNYFGQGALLLGHPEMNVNPFYGIVPGFLLYPMVCLSTAATVIASQALISGAFSLTQQAVQLGLCPRLHIIHTSSDIRGQIYIPFVNAALLIACLLVVVGFKESSGLAGAYGIAVTGTMIITSVLFFLVMTRQWRWSGWKAIPLAGVFVLFDLAFIGGNVFKIADGGWLPLFVAAIIAFLMTTWKKGRAELASMLRGERFPIDVFLKNLAGGNLTRVPGTAVFLTLSPEGTPPALLHHVKHNRMLHEKVALLTIRFADAPHVPPEERIRCDDLGQGFYRIVASYGYMQTPDVPQILRGVLPYGLAADPMTTTYYLGRETLLTGGKSHMMRWRKAIFAFMSKNAGNPTTYFGIPPNRVVELGAQIEL